MQDLNLNNTFCKQHNLLAYEICLHGGPMKSRLLCKLCKKSLSKEQLIDTVSISDFISGNFMRIIEASLIQQSLNAEHDSPENSLEKQIDLFFDDILNSLNQSREQALKIVRKQVVLKKCGCQIKEKRDTLAAKLALVQDNWNEKVYDEKLLNDIALYSSDLTGLLISRLEKDSSLVKSQGEINEILILNKIFSEKIERELNDYQFSLLQQSENGKSESSSDQKNYSKIQLHNQVHKSIEDDKKPLKKIKTGTFTKITTTSTTEIVEMNSSQSRSPIVSDNDLDFKLDYSLSDHHDYIFWGGLCYVEEENHLVTAGSEGKINVWDFNSKVLLYTKNTGIKIYMITYVKNKGTIIAAGGDGKVRVFNVKNNYELMHVFQLHTNQIFGVIYLPDFDLHASCGDHAGITLWNYDDTEWHEIRTLDTRKKQASSLCYVEEQNILVCGLSRGGRLMAFNPAQQKNIKVVKAHKKEKSIDSIIYVPEWKQIISGAEDAQVKFWDFQNKDSSNFLTCLKTLVRENSYIECLAVDIERNYLFHANLDDYFTVWDVSQNQIIKNVRGHRRGDRGEALLYLKAQGQLVTAFEQEIKFWKVSFTSDDTA